jgi:hypothetical protein
MKRYLRLFILLGFGLVLPFNGWAAVSAFIEPCPMQAAGMDMAAAGAECCEDEPGAASKSQPCKSGQECKTSSWLQVSILKTPTAPPPSAQLIVAPIASVGSPPLAGVWRPPRA